MRVSSHICVLNKEVYNMDMICTDQSGLAYSASLQLISFHSYLRVYTPFHEEGEISKGEKFAQALANDLIMIGVILVITVLFVLLYKGRCYKVYYKSCYCILCQLNQFLNNSLGNV